MISSLEPLEIHISQFGSKFIEKSKMHKSCFWSLLLHSRIFQFSELSYEIYGNVSLLGGGNCSIFPIIFRFF